MAAKAKKQNTEAKMSQGELEKELVKLREEKREIGFKALGSRSKNVKELWSLRKKIARVLTAMNNPTTK
jgi:ribosomal protein L29